MRRFQSITPFALKRDECVTNDECINARAFTAPTASRNRRNSREALRQRVRHKRFGLFDEFFFKEVQTREFCGEFVILSASLDTVIIVEIRQRA